MLNFVILDMLHIVIGTKVPIKVVFKLMIVKLVIGDLITILKALRSLNDFSSSALQS